MQRLFWLFIGVLLLAACGAAAPQPESAGETAVAPATASENPADTAVNPATTVAEASIVRDRDWVLGADEPAVTIIEYGDFQ
jgi:hypothetical protein